MLQCQLVDQFAGKRATKSLWATVRNKPVTPMWPLLTFKQMFIFLPLLSQLMQELLPAAGCIRQESYANAGCKEASGKLPQRSWHTAVLLLTKTEYAGSGLGLTKSYTVTIFRHADVAAVWILLAWYVFVRSVAFVDWSKKIEIVIFIVLHVFTYLCSKKAM